MSWIAAVIGRLLLAALFFASGLQKLIDPGPTAAALEAAHLPAGLALPTGLFESVCGVLLAVGLMTRLIAVLLAGFTALTILFFHNQFTDPAQSVQAIKNVAIIGGLLMVFAYGQMRGSYDYLREQRRTHKAEVRAARAEGRVEGATTAHTVEVDGSGVATLKPKRRWF
jgi:putative oxidoreductase